MRLDLMDETEIITRIKVIGVGGGGGNVVNRMVDTGVKGVEFVAMNTDRQALNKSHADVKLQIGERATGGRGAGANPEKGQKAAEESAEALEQILAGTDMVFITAGMGGGTGTGAAPIVAQMAKDKGILTVGVVTKPFDFEGKHRMKQAEDGIAKLAENVDSLIVIPNERLKLVSEQRITLMNAFAVADDVLKNGVLSIVELITQDAMINLDFADVTSVMKDAGHAHMGVGRASGKDKAEAAAKAAVTSPLLESSINGAKGLIILIKACEDINLDEIDTASEYVKNMADPDANIIFGVSLDSSLNDEIVVTVVATGFGKDSNNVPEPPRSGSARGAIDAIFGTGRTGNPNAEDALLSIFGQDGSN